MKSWFRRQWVGFFFAPAGPLNLGVCRALFFALMLAWYGFQDYASWGTIPRAFCLPKHSCLQFLLPVFSVPVLQIFQVVWVAALALSCVGLWSRWSTAAAFVLGFYLIGLPTVTGKISHHDPLPVLIAGILMCSRCGEAFSLDAWRRRRHVPGRQMTPSSGEYTWPIRLVWVLFSFAFFAAGFAKLRCSGLAWIFSDNLANRLLQGPNHLENTWIIPELSFGLARHVWMCQVMAGMTIFLEIGFPLALFSWRLRWLFVPGMLGANVGILFLMGPNFLPFMACNLFWVPWDRVIQKLAGSAQVTRAHGTRLTEIRARAA